MATALITGASAGIGDALARRFAKHRHDVVLVARRKDRLESLAEELAETYGVKTWAMPCDLTDRAAVQDLVNSIDAEGIEIEMLVNNAGFGSHGPFIEQDHARELRQIDLNVTALVSLSRTFGAKMAKRRSGKIMNIASIAAFQPGPHMAVYFATKAFVVSFSEALAFELRDQGVTVTAHCPGATESEFAAEAGNDKTFLFESGAVSTADEVADHAYAAMMRGDVIAIPGALNKFSAFMAQVAPRRLVRWLAAKVNRAT